MAASCTLNKLEQPVASGAEGTIVSFTATVPQADTKAVVHEGESGPEVYWSPGDRIHLYRADWGGSIMSSQNTEPSPTATFSGSISGIAGDIDAKHKMWALYPYMQNEGVSFTPDSLIVPMHESQKPVEGSFDPQSLLMLAQTTTRELAFYHVGGGFKFKVSGDWIRQVEFRANDGTPLAGRVVLKMDGAGRPTVTKVVEGVPSITMTMPGSECFKPDTWYYLNTLPAVLEKGYTMFFRSETQTGKVVVNDPREIKRAVWASLKDDAAADANAEIKPETNLIRNEIWYTTTDGQTVSPNNAYEFGANIVSNTYNDGQGVIVFDGPIVKIPDNAFSSKSTLISVQLPNSVRFIGNYAFAHNWENMQSVTLSEGVETIGEGAFYHVGKMQSLWIPGSVRRIGRDAFIYCSQLSTFSGPLASDDGHFLVIDGALVGACYTGYDAGNVIIPEGVTSVADRVFASIYGIQYVYFPETLQHIGEEVFAFCESLEGFGGKFVDESGHFLIFDGEIKAAAVSGLPNPEIPATVTSIASRAFCSAGGFLSLSIPASVVKIGDYAFIGCYSLQTVEIAGAETVFGKSVFRNCGSLQSFSGPLAQDDRFLVTAEKTLIAFAPQGATEIAIPEGVTKIGSEVFHTCSNLTTVTFPATIKEIGEDAFYQCTNLENVTLPEGLLKIDEGAFYYCTSFTKFTIPSTVTHVGVYIVGGCGNLTEVRALPTTPPICQQGYMPLFWSDVTAPILVPAASLNAYKNADGWMWQSNYQAIPEE